MSTVAHKVSLVGRRWLMSSSAGGCGAGLGRWLGGRVVDEVVTLVWHGCGFGVEVDPQRVTAVIVEGGFGYVAPAHDVFATSVVVAGHCSGIVVRVREHRQLFASPGENAGRGRSFSACNPQRFQTRSDDEKIARH